MTGPALHRWTNDPQEATCIQEDLRQSLVLAWDGRPIHLLAGIDASHSDRLVCAAIATYRFPELSLSEMVSGEAQSALPYIPGLLAFRLMPAILKAWAKLTRKPDLLLVHGHGIAHPRGVGLASHLGLWLDRPSIGVAKRRLYGCQTEPSPNIGDWSDLRDEAEPQRVIGALLRTRLDAQPIYVSPGHLIDLERSMQFVLACCQGYRMPEPIRFAHKQAVLTTQLN